MDQGKDVILFSSGTIRTATIVKRNCKTNW